MKSTTANIPENNELTAKSSEDTENENHAEIRNVLPKGIH